MLSILSSKLSHLSNCAFFVNVVKIADVKMILPKLADAPYVSTEIQGEFEDAFEAAVNAIMAGNLVVSILLATAL